MTTRTLPTITALLRVGDAVRALAPAEQMAHVRDTLDAVSSLSEGLRVMGEMAARHDASHARAPVDKSIAFDLIGDVAGIVANLANSASLAIERIDGGAAQC